MHDLSVVGKTVSIENPRQTTTTRLYSIQFSTVLLQKKNYFTLGNTSYFFEWCPVPAESTDFPPNTCSLSTSIQYHFLIEQVIRYSPLYSFISSQFYVRILFLDAVIYHIFFGFRSFKITSYLHVLTENNTVWHTLCYVYSRISACATKFAMKVLGTS